MICILCRNQNSQERTQYRDHQQQQDQAGRLHADLAQYRIAQRHGQHCAKLRHVCHGIYNSVHPDTRLIYLASPDPALRRRLLQIRSVIADTTSHQSVIGSAFAGFDPEPNDCVLPLIDDPDFHVLEYILPLQIVASRLPYRLGIDPFYAADPHFHQRAGSKQTG